MKTKKKTAVPPLATIEHKRDAYGFIIRPQHVQRYRQYANIYKEEEEERSDRWNFFLERVSESAQLSIDGLSSEEVDKEEAHKTSKANINYLVAADSHFHVDTDINHMPSSEGSVESGTLALAVDRKKTHKVQEWSEIRSSLCPIEDMMSVRVQKSTSSAREVDNNSQKACPSIEDARSGERVPEEDSEEEFYDVDRLDQARDVPSTATGAPHATDSFCDGINMESIYPWKEELEVLVRGGLPIALRGELWQAFAGVKVRRIDKYYQELLSVESNLGNQHKIQEKNDGSNEGSLGLGEKWKRQIEKDLPRTFPGHPALDEDGRNALRRLLIAYARHNPSVGYCQAMNFFGGLLLLLMPEENAFWTLMGIMDDYFDGYYTEEMTECQVDQLVFEELVRERLPKLVNHLDYLGVQVAWVTGPWFLSIFMNMLPWESVLRIWDVLLFEGNRVILFRTALTLMELYGPALVTTKDAGDAATLMQSLAGSTFDSSQLVLTACMGYQNVHESKLRELRDKYRPSVIAANEDRSKGLKALENSKNVVSKLYSFKHDPGSVMINDAKVPEGRMNCDTSQSESGTNGSENIIPCLDLQEQVGWLKIELCKLLEEKRSAELRAEELQTALMEMVKQDNRRQLCATIEKMEQEVSELRLAMVNKQEQENAMLQVLMRVEKEQRVTEDARMFAEQEAASQRDASQVLQEKYEKAMVSLAEMEKRLVMSESMLKATLQYQSGQIKAQTSPRIAQPSTEVSPTITSLLTRPFGFGWREKNKGISANAAESC